MARYVLLPPRNLLTRRVAGGFPLLDCLNRRPSIAIQLDCLIDERPERVELAAPAHALTKGVQPVAHHAQVVHRQFFGVTPGTSERNPQFGSVTMRKKTDRSAVRTLSTTSFAYMSFE